MPRRVLGIFDSVRSLFFILFLTINLSSPESACAELLQRGGPPPEGAGAIIQRATLSPPTTLRGRNTKTVLFGPSTPNAPPLLYSVLQRETEAREIHDQVVLFDAARNGIVGDAPTLPALDRRITDLTTDASRRLLVVTRGTQAALDIYTISDNGALSGRRTVDPLGLVAAQNERNDVEPANVALTPDGTMAFYAVPGDGRVFGVNTQTAGIVFSGNAGVEPGQAAVSPNGAVLAVVAKGNASVPSSVALFDLPASGVNVMPRGRFVLPAGALTDHARLAFDAQGRMLYVPGGKSNQIYVVPATLVGTSSAFVATHEIGGEALTLASGDNNRRLAVLRPAQVSGSGTLVTTASGTITLFAIAAESGLLEQTGVFRSPAALPFHRSAVTFVPGTRWVASFTYVEENALLVIDGARTGVFEQALGWARLPRRITAIDISADGGYLGAAMLATVVPLQSAVIAHIAPDFDLNSNGVVDESDLLSIIKKRKTNFRYPAATEFLLFSKAWRK